MLGWAVSDGILWQTIWDVISISLSVQSLSVEDGCCTGDSRCLSTILSHNKGKIL